MKKIFTNILTKLAMVAVLATAFAGSAWATDFTLSAASSVTKDGITISFNKGSGSNAPTWYDAGLRLYSNNTITIESSNTISSITFNWEKQGNKAFASVTANPGTYSHPSTTGDGTWTGSATSITFTLGSSGQLQLNTLSVTAAGGSTSLVNSDFALTGAPVALSFDLYNNKTAQTVSYTTSSTGAVTVSGGTGYITTSVNSGNKTITVTPVAETPSAQTITINQAADDTYAAGSATFTVSIADSTPYTQPTQITITPNYTFWGKSAQFSGDTNNELNGSKDNVSLEWSRGSGSTYANTTAMRFYKDNTLTFTAPTGYEIKSIDLTVSGTYSDLAFSPSGWDNENTKWTGSSETVTMSRPSNASSYATISKFTITIGKPSTDPAISANDIDIDYDANNGTIDFAISNSVAGGSISASTEANWLTLGSETTSPITFTCSANSETTARSATVTLTYTYDSNKTVTKDVTVTQAAAPVIYSTIPTLFAAATSSEKSVNVTLDSWVVSGVSTNGKNIYVTDNSSNGFIIYYTSDMSGTYHAGDIISGTNVSCDLVLYNGAAEIKNLDASDVTITSGGTVSVSNIAMANLAAINSGALVSYSNLTCSISNNKYYLSDGTTTLQLYNQLFAFDALSAGKEYNITGVYLHYNSTKEIMPRSAADIQEIVPIIPTVTPATTSINVIAAGGDGTIAVTYDNITDVAAEVAFYQSNGTTSATYDWITASVNNENNVEYLVEENTSSEPRTAYMKVWAYDDNLNEVYSDLITITQAGFVADYATLPFAYDGNGAGTLPAGFTVSGLGTYNSSPAMKFDGTGDYAILKINERPGILSFDILGNSFSGGTFKVQTSVDGTTYTDLKTYTELGTKQNESVDNLGEDVRYIKWIYTNKSSGNVALGNIKLAEYNSTPSITVASNTIDAPVTGIAEGTLNVTYWNIDMSLGAAIAWYESDGTTTATQPSWITASIGTSKNVIYQIAANKGAARNAYFKVYGRDSGSSNNVYSELVTVSQAEYIPNYATLPFEWDDNTTPKGITNSGVGTYTSSPYLKFDTTGDYIILEFNETPGTLTFDIKGNTFSGGTFKVQTSVDGETFTDLKTYTALDATQSEEFSLESNVRCIKWIYVEKVSGNVALGNIKLTAMAAADSYIIEGAPNNGQYWASFYCNAAGYTISEGAKAFTMNASKQLYLLGDGNVIPANTAVIIISDTDTITLTKTDNASATVYGGANILVGSDSDTAASGITGIPYVLSIVNNALGFYKFTGTIPANKAYYIVNE